MKKILILMIATVVVSSCMRDLYINVTEPAPVTIPSYVKKVGVIDRSSPTDNTKALDAVDKVLSLEGANLDREGAAESIRGLADELMNNKRFTEVKALENIDFRTPASVGYPVPLSWEIVSQICRETGTDALFSLEKFDTDTKLNYSTRPIQLKTPFGNVPGTEHQARMETIVKTGWRIYDPEGRTILDEFGYDESLVFTGTGINPVLAAAGLIGRNDAVKKVGYKAGNGYAWRLIPYRSRVYRSYYVKGTNNFKMARRKAEMGKWDEAGELWLKETSNSSLKVAGRASYNMAIINEINGDLESAIQWAQKAYEDYNNKNGRDYVRILENRRYRNEVLSMQEDQ